MGKGCFVVCDSEGYVLFDVEELFFFDEEILMLLLCIVWFFYCLGCLSEEGYVYFV